MSTRLALRIQERIGHLTKSEQKLAQVILESPGLIETHSATELAGLAQVSKATAARFFRALGYADFEQVKLQAREERNRTQPYAHATVAQTPRAMGRSLAEHLELELANLSRTFEEITPDHLREAARLVQEAPRLWLLGLDDDAWLSRHAHGLLSRLRPEVQVLGLNDGSLTADLAMIGPRDTVIVFCQGRKPRALKPVLSFIRTTGTRVLALTDRSNLPVVRPFATKLLFCHVSNYGAISSATTLVSLLRMLAVALVGLSPVSTGQRTRLIDEISEELDLSD